MRSYTSDEQRSATTVVIMARYPQLGSTKKRLARTLGDEQTLYLYRAFLRDLANHFSGQDYDLHWAYTPATAHFADFMASLSPSPRCFPTQGNNLGEHLLSAFRWTWQQGYTATIVIASDTPHITHSILFQARSALQEADVVLGPADDGGYYVIAMCKPYDVFSTIPMSNNMVTARTIARAYAQGLTVRLIEPLFDIDEYGDLVRLAQLLKINRTLAPATAAAIAHLAL